MSEMLPAVSRRTFVKATGALGALAAAGGTMAASEAVFGNATQAHADEPEKLVWSQCNVNCGGRCIFHWHTKGGKIQYMTTDDIGDDNFQARACLRGRVMRQWVNNPDRLQYPMKRVGKRGEGKFERISWDEAVQTIADKIRYTIDTYGNDSIYVNYATGMYSATGRSVERLLNCVGGYLPMYGDYSTGMHQYVMPFMYGIGVSPYENVSASSVDQAQNADLVLMFGNSPADNRMGGANVVWDYNAVREAGPEIIHIDYRLNETAAGYPSEWLPIRTGTDAALVAGIAHELIKNDWVDLDFLHRCCVGYDEETMPESAKGQNKSYHSYIMGLGYDKVEKTPEWAAEITLVPAEKIRELTAKIHNAKAMFVVQGWGLQRHSNGESATRAVCMLALLTGNIGKPGTNSGMREAEPPGAPVGSLPSSDEDPNGAPMNMVNAKISCYSWLKAIDEGSDFQKELDATDEIALFMGAQNPEMAEAAAKIEAPKNGIKMLWNYAGNCITNQHGDINKVYEVLSDESKCEFIVGCDTFMTDSAKYCDILLPDAMRAEQLNMSTNGYSEYYWGVTVGGPAQEPPFECRPIYDVHADIAEKLGVRDKFTLGKTQDEWIEELYKAGAAADPEMPSWEGILEQGVFKRQLPTAIAFEANVADPVGHPWNTPSGKIEIYSECLAKIAEDRELEGRLTEGQVIAPIPLFDPGVEGYGSVTDEFPLYMSGWHDKARTHSSFGALEVLKDYNRHRLWINPLDAQPRGINDGDKVRVKSPAGEVEIEAHVTSRIVPTVVAMPQGFWHDADMTGNKLDKGGCINTLTTYVPSPLAHGNGPSNSIIAEVTKA
ncbi:DMSO/selenate family reductase complex A subunit [Anaerotardibacter muris]|uniref:DMSO/selenate family reductase complex A subunit n=1 Tax=Anaerotardibacter muris TaxID=2941505 RepID=UPI00203C9E1E|nr:DMSO/selenate family reductase complex A subunit [Anaerotardibacter muris]